MTDWIDFAVYAAFLFALYFAQPTTQQRLIVPLLADRNAEWVAAHPDTVRRIAASRWRLWLSYGLGAISLAVLASYQLGLWHLPPTRGGFIPPKWAVLWNLAMAGMIAAMVIGGAIGLWAHFAIKRLIPVAPRRQATLERRSLDTSVPRWVQHVTYALVMINLAAWIVVAILGRYSSPDFWNRLVTMFGLSGFFFWATRAMVARRPNALDRIFGAAHRTWEVRLTFSTLLVPPMIGALRLSEEIAGTATHYWDLSRAEQLALAIFLTFWLLSMSRLPLDQAGTPLAQQGGRKPAHS
jgi:hypothetical protein